MYINYRDPMITREIQTMRRNRYLGSWLSDITNKVKSEVTGITLQTGSGRVVIDPKTGVSYTTTGQPATGTAKATTTTASSVAASAADTFSELVKKPAFLLSVAGLVLMLMRGNK